MTKGPHRRIAVHEFRQLFIGGKWVDPSSSDVIEVISPHTE